jgi:hypothetical protein
MDRYLLSIDKCIAASRFMRSMTFLPQPRQGQAVTLGCLDKPAAAASYEKPFLIVFDALRDQSATSAF